jgi:prepilin signal peptidase PulO-like enzyme (type II secretory pathway)
MSTRERALYFAAALVAAFVVAFLLGRAAAPLVGDTDTEHPHSIGLES